MLGYKNFVKKLPDVTIKSLNCYKLVILKQFMIKK